MARTLSNHNIFSFAFASALLTVLLIFSSRAQASPRIPQRFDEAKQEFLDLRSKGYGAASLDEIERVNSALLSFAAGASREDALLLLGELNLKIYEDQHYLPGLFRAMDYYRRLGDGNSEIGNQALLRLALLEVKYFKDSARAAALLQELVSKYPNSNVAAAARSRLESLKSEIQSGGSRDAVERKHRRKADVSTELRRERDYGPMIAIDPGHGGEDLGAPGVNGVLEKDVVLNIATYLDELLRERLRARTVLTRVRDVVVPLGDRTKIANDANADLFLSIHTNASPNHAAFGIETYYLDNTDEKSSLKLAERENNSIQYGGEKDDLSFIFSDLIQNVKLGDSIAMAHFVQDSLRSTLSRGFGEARSLGVKRAPFYVLVGAHMPCILAEVSFIDNRIEGAKLITQDYQMAVAQALYQAVRRFFETRE